MTRTLRIVGVLGVLGLVVRSNYLTRQRLHTEIRHLNSLARVLTQQDKQIEALDDNQHALATKLGNINELLDLTRSQVANTLVSDRDHLDVWTDGVMNRLNALEAFAADQ